MSKNLTLAVAACALGFGLAACDVEKTQEGSVTAPKIEAKKTQDGDVAAPKYSVTPPDVTVTQQKETVDVPTVRTEEKTMDVPKVEVTPAKEK